MMWFSHHRWSRGTQCRLAMVSALYHSSNNLSPGYLPRYVPVMPCVLFRLVFSSQLNLTLVIYASYWCLLCCLCSALRFPCGCYVHQWGLNHRGLQCHNPIEYILGKHMHSRWLSISHVRSVQWLFLPLLWEEGASCYLLSCPSHSVNMVGNTALRAWQRVTQSSTFPK